MTPDRSSDYLIGLVQELCKLPNETEWIEFKENNDDPQAIGEYISALANSAVIKGKHNAYLIWGVRNEDHEIVGTNVQPKKQKKGNQPLESWLLQLLEPHIHWVYVPFNAEIGKLRKQ